MDTFGNERAIKMKTDELQNKLLKEAAEWRLISLLFECPTKGLCELIDSLSLEITDKDLKLAATAAQVEASEGLYHSIFGPGGPAPAREVSYRNWVQPGYLLSELSSYYDAFSFQPETEETPDHISVETAFIAYLRLKEVFARDCLDIEHANITAESSQNFIDEHLSYMAEPLAKTLALSGVTYLALNAAALLQRVGVKNSKSKIKALPVLSDFEDENFECGNV